MTAITDGPLRVFLVEQVRQPLIPGRESHISSPLFFLDRNAVLSREFLRDFPRSLQVPVTEVFMRINTLTKAVAKTHSVPVHRVVPHPHNVVCIYCYRTMGRAGSEKKQAELLHSHNCVEERLAKQPAAPPPFN